MNLASDLLCVKTRDTYEETGTEYGCLPSLLGDGDKGIEIVYGEEKIYCTRPTRAAMRQSKNLLYRHNKPIESTKEVPLSFVLFESLFTSVSTGKNKKRHSITPAKA
jgi:hypothetical protein